jgi:hypothetical protein
MPRLGACQRAHVRVCGGCVGGVLAQLHIVENGVVSKWVAGKRGTTIAHSGPTVATLRVHVQSAAGLAAADSNGFSDPYVKVSGAGQTATTRTVSRSLDPVWSAQEAD